MGITRIMNQADKNNILRDWVEKFSDELYSWANYKTSNHAVSEDLVQDTFLSALNGIEGFQHKSNPKTWLFAILNNKIHDFYRNRMKQSLTELQEEKDYTAYGHFDETQNWSNHKMPREWSMDNEPHLLDDEGFTMTLEDCLNELPEHWFLAVQFKYLLGRDAKAICQELNISTTNYWQILHRAKLQLRDCIELKWFRI